MPSESVTAKKGTSETTMAAQAPACSAEHDAAEGDGLPTGWASAIDANTGAAACLRHAAIRPPLVDPRIRVCACVRRVSDALRLARAEVLLQRDDGTAPQGRHGDRACDVAEFAYHNACHSRRVVPSRMMCARALPST